MSSSVKYEREDERKKQVLSMLLQYLTKEHNSAPSTQPILD